MWYKINGKKWLSLEVFKKEHSWFAVYEVALILPWNKCIESQIYWNKSFWQWLDFSFRWDRNVDHAGLHISIGVAWFQFEWDLYDGRHWNTKENRWAQDGEH